jgi:hypothetical protein
MEKDGSPTKTAGKGVGKREKKKKDVQAVTGSGGRGGRKKLSKSLRAGLTFPVTRIRRYLRAGRYAKIIGQGASVYLGRFENSKTMFPVRCHNRLLPYLYSVCIGVSFC